MKKLFCGALPFLGLALLAGCGPQQPDNKVNEQQFNDALAFKNVDYAHLTLTTTVMGPTEITRVGEVWVSPTVALRILDYQTEKMYQEMYAKKTIDEEGDTAYLLYSRRDKETNVYKTGVSYDPDDFPTPTTLKQEFEKYNFDYKDFAYDNATSSYVKTSSSPDGLTQKFALKFDTNKKLSSLNFDTTAPNTHQIVDYVITYDKVTPTLPVIDFKVNQQEFNDAITYKDVEYLEVDGEMTKIIGDVEQYSSSVLRCSPKASAVVTSSTTFSEKITKVIERDGQTIYQVFEREEKSTPSIYSFRESTDPKDFVTPQTSDEININKLIQNAGLTFADFTYNENNSSYVASAEGKTAGEVDTFKLHFEYKRLIDFELEIKINGQRLSLTKMSYDYDEMAPYVPTILSETEFNDAITFKNVGFMQTTKVSTVKGEDGNYEINYSPTVYKVILRIFDEGRYQENIVAKDKPMGGQYEKYYRTTPDGPYTKEAATASEFLTPTNASIKATLDTYGITYNDFLYNDTDDAYVAIHDDNEKVVTFVLTFNNKKVTWFEEITYDKQSGENSTTTNTYGYKEITPDVPEV